jgi:hypothetical protein
MLPFRLHIHPVAVGEAVPGGVAGRRDAHGFMAMPTYASRSVVAYVLATTWAHAVLTFMPSHGPTPLHLRRRGFGKGAYVLIEKRLVRPYKEVLRRWRGGCG